MPPRIARLAALGAFGACAGMLALYGLLIYVTRHTALEGMTPTLAWVSWISLGIVFAALIVAHLAIGKQLMRIAKDEGPTRV